MIKLGFTPSWSWPWVNRQAITNLLPRIEELPSLRELVRAGLGRLGLLKTGKQRPQSRNAGAYNPNGVFDKTPKDGVRGVDYWAFNRRSYSNSESKILHVTSVKNTKGFSLTQFTIWANMITRVRPAATTLIIERLSVKETNPLPANSAKKLTYIEPRRKMPAIANFCFGGNFNFIRGGNGRAKIITSRMRLDIAPPR